VTGQYSSDRTLKAREWGLRVVVMWAGLYSYRRGPVKERARKPEHSLQSVANETAVVAAGVQRGSEIPLQTMWVFLKTVQWWSQHASGRSV